MGVYMVCKGHRGQPHAWLGGLTQTSTMRPCLAMDYRGDNLDIVHKQIKEQTPLYVYTVLVVVSWQTLLVRRWCVLAY